MAKKSNLPLDNKVKVKKILDKDVVLTLYKELQLELNELLVAMMADLIKIDQRNNLAAALRFRVNSVKFTKVSKEFRRISLLAREYHKKIYLQ